MSGRFGLLSGGVWECLGCTGDIEHVLSEFFVSGSVGLLSGGVCRVFRLYWRY